MVSSPQRQTRQRVAVSEVLSESRQFRTAAQVHDDLRAAGHLVGLTTVYRTLQMMADADQLDSIRTDDGEIAYRRCSMGHHHHLVCRNCGRTVEVEGLAIERWAAKTADDHGFTDVQHQLEIFGLCPECRNSR